MKKKTITPTIPTRGRQFTGTVVNVPLHSSAIVEWESRVIIPKYERYQKHKSRIRVHSPEQIGAKYGDSVLIQETRPISKTKKFMIIKILGRDMRFIERAEALEAAKFKKPVKEQEKSAEKAKPTGQGAAPQ